MWFDYVDGLFGEQIGGVFPEGFPRYVHPPSHVISPVCVLKLQLSIYIVVLRKSCKTDYIQYLLLHELYGRSSLDVRSSIRSESQSLVFPAYSFQCNGLDAICQQRAFCNYHLWGTAAGFSGAVVNPMVRSRKELGVAFLEGKDVSYCFFEI